MLLHFLSLIFSFSVASESIRFFSFSSSTFFARSSSAFCLACSVNRSVSCSACSVCPTKCSDLFEMTNLLLHFIDFCANLGGLVSSCTLSQRLNPGSIWRGCELWYASCHRVITSWTRSSLAYLRRCDLVSSLISDGLVTESVNLLLNFFWVTAPVNFSLVLGRC
jgi:hypothetical protein